MTLEQQELDRVIFDLEGFKYKLPFMDREFIEKQLVVLRKLQDKYIEKTSR